MADQRPDSQDDALVTYPVRDLLERLERHIENLDQRITKALASKADHADIDRLDARLNAQGVVIEDHGERIAGIEQRESARKQAADVHQERDRRFSKRTKGAWIVISTVLLIVATFLGPQVHLF